MPAMKPGETPEQFAIRRAYETGHFWSPENADGPNVKESDLKKLDTRESVVVSAFRSLSRMMVRDYAVSVAKHHGRAPDFDGDLGPAMMDIMQTERCAVPDYRPPAGAVFAFDDPQLQEVCEAYQAAPAVSNGNWPRCHNVGEFHCCVVRVSMKYRPSWATDAVMVQVWKNVQAAYDKLGLHIIFVDENMKDLITGEDRQGQHVDIESTWVPTSSGWIGLAILTLGLGCSDSIWQRYLNTYSGGSSQAAQITQNTTLWKHETGHNTGLEHSNGGVMNPSIVNNLPIEWTPSDPSTSTLKARYGGAPYVPPGGNPTPTPTPTPTPGTIEERLAALERQQFEDNIKNAVQDVRIQLLEKRP